MAAKQSGKNSSNANSKNKKQMVINYVPGEECRVAMVEGGRLEEFHDERANAVTIVGNVYVGKVMNVEASIQAAFIDFGQGANGFLHVSDLHPQYFPGEDEDTRERIGKKTPRRERPPIQQCLKRGQEVIVQVLKEGISTKGPTLTTYLSIPGRYLVMLPQMDRVGVSRKVEDEDQRKAMREVLDGLELPGEFGFIVRTAGLGKTKTDLKRDLAYLQRLWKDIERRRTRGKGPRLLYAESDLLMRALRDYWTSEIDEIVIDDESALRRAARFMKIVSPRSATRLLNYNRSAPIFHAFGIEEQIQRMHERVVPLPSGGSLIIDETEALVAIDVNSGKMRHHGDAETTAYQTNLEAVDEICRQIRLRDVGGLIVCDLIDMMKRSNRRNVEQRMRDRLKRDRASTKPLPISQFGIVEMTRQRMRGSLRSTHYTKCPMCAGRGVLRRPASLASDALRELGALLDHNKVDKVEMVVSPRLAGELLSNKRLSLTRQEYRSSKKVDVRVSEDIPVDQLRFYAYDDAGADVAIDRLPKPTPPNDLDEWAGSDAESNEWAVDTIAESEELDAAVSEAPDQTGAMEGFLAADDPIADDENLDEPKPAKRRRRRRGGKRSRGGGDAEDKPKADARDEPEPAKTDDAEPGESAESDDAQPKKKRRRRRRGGRAVRERKEKAAAKAAAQAAAEGSGDAEDKPKADAKDAEPKGSGAARAEPDKKPAAPAPKRDNEPRKDSWDLTPEELAARNGNAKKPAPAADGASDDTPAEAPKKKSRRRSRGKKTTAKADAPVDTEAKDAKAQPKPEPKAKDDAEDKPKAPSKKRRRSKKTTPAKAGDDAPAKGDKPAADDKKPVRSLYATQRKKPAAAARAAHED